MALRISIVRTEGPAPARRRRSWTVAAATIVAVVLVSGVSYAYWTATGTGTASVTAVTAKLVNVSPVAVTDLYPGKTDDVTVSLQNTNSYGVTVSLTALSVASVTGGIGPGACAATNFTAKTGPYTPASIIVAGNTTVSVTMVGLVTMVGGALDNCQGATVNLSMTFSGLSN